MLSVSQREKNIQSFRLTSEIHASHSPRFKMSSNSTDGLGTIGFQDAPLYPLSQPSAYMRNVRARWINVDRLRHQIAEIIPRLRSIEPVHVPDDPQEPSTCEALSGCTADMQTSWSLPTQLPPTWR